MFLHMYGMPAPLAQLMPNGAFGPTEVDFWSRTNVADYRQSKQSLRQGEKFFGYVTLQCSDCAVFRTYWMYFEAGHNGYHREGSSLEYDVFFSIRDVDSFVNSFLHSKGLVAIRTEDNPSSPK